MNNYYIKSDVIKYILLLSNFTTELQVSAKKNDAVIDKKEQQLIKKINDKTERYIKDLKSLIDF